MKGGSHPVVLPRFAQGDDVSGLIREGNRSHGRDPEEEDEAEGASMGVATRSRHGRGGVTGRVVEETDSQTRVKEKKRKTNS